VTAASIGVAFAFASSTLQRPENRPREARTVPEGARAGRAVAPLHIGSDAGAQGDTAVAVFTTRLELNDIILLE
jgi:hypothetical protein